MQHLVSGRRTLRLRAWALCWWRHVQAGAPSADQRRLRCGCCAEQGVSRGADGGSSAVWQAGVFFHVLFPAQQQRGRSSRHSFSAFASACVLVFSALPSLKAWHRLETGVLIMSVKPVLQHILGSPDQKPTFGPVCQVIGSPAGLSRRYFSSEPPPRKGELPAFLREQPVHAL